MNLGIYTANLSPQDRWERMQRMGFAWYIVRETLTIVCIVLFVNLLMDYFGMNHVVMSSDEVFFSYIGAGTGAVVISIFSWRSAEEKAGDSDCSLKL
jgi:hypothetical protein